MSKHQYRMFNVGSHFTSKLCLISKTSIGLTVGLPVFSKILTLCYDGRSAGHQL